MIGFLMRKLFYKKLTSKLTEISINEDGFSLQEPFGAEPKVFTWDFITDIYFSETKNEIIIQTLEKQINLTNKYIGWYELIQNVPNKFVNFDFDYVVLLLNSLQSCEICGIVAVKENECIVCENTPWNTKMDQNKIEYLKLMQLKLFSLRIKEGREIKSQTEPEHGFKSNKDWKLYI
jgi:hypothetical protein